KPRERALPALALERLTTRGRAAAVGAALARGGPSDRLLDLDHQALAREPLLVDGAPAAEDLVVDLEDPGSRGVLRRVLLRNRLVDRPEAVLREKILGPGRLGEADELLRQVLVRAFLEDGDRQLDQHALPRDDVLDVRPVEA